jgi:NADH-quinone oxidoreductase subunit L
VVQSTEPARAFADRHGSGVVLSSDPDADLPWFTIFGHPIALSGYHSKDAIIATALAYMYQNPVHILLFIVPLITAGLTAFYMFRLWFYTFWGEPRDQHIYDHAHESPWVMTGPLIVLAFFAAFVAIGGEQGILFQSIKGSEPAAFHSLQAERGEMGMPVTLPGHAEVLDVHSEAGMYALIVAFSGAVLAFIVYGARIVDPADIKKQFAGVHGFLVEKWQFDELYDAMFVRPAHVVGRWMTLIDKNVLDAFLHWLARITVKVSVWDRWFDEKAVDGLVQLLGDKTHAAGASLRSVQTGNLRGYVLTILIAVGALAFLVPLFVF